MNSLKIASALRVLALAFEATEDETNQAAAPAAEPAKRGRGRPVKGEEISAPAASALAPASSTTSPTPAVAVVDPFASSPTTPTATLEEVREALKALAAARSQAVALDILKAAGGAVNLTDLAAANYGAVVFAAKAALPQATPAAAEVDPFDIPAGTPAVEVKTPTEDDVRAEVVASSKRTSPDTVAKVVMGFGGKAAGPDGVFKPSWKVLPKDKYAETIAALKALPTTK